MKVIDAEQAQQTLVELVNETVESHRPIQIAAGSAQAVLVAEEDWRAIEETLFLLSIPGMRESILAGAATPIEECTDTLDWDALPEADDAPDEQE